MKARVYTPWPHGDGKKLVMEIELETAPRVLVDQDTRKGDPFRVFVRSGVERADGGMVFPQEAGDPTHVVRYIETTYHFVDLPASPKEQRICRGCQEPVDPAHPDLHDGHEDHL